MFGLKSEILRAVDEYGMIVPSKGTVNITYTPEPFNQSI
jgi:hypothetical protein